MEQLPCPDGFLIDAGDGLRAAHEQINFWLIDAEEWEAKRPNHTRIMDHKELKKQFTKRQLVEFIAAALVRADWHTRQISNLVEAGPYSKRIGYILLALFRIPLAFSDEHLDAVLNYAIARGGFWWPREEICDRIEDEFQRRDLPAGTWRLIHQLHQAMASENSIEAQAVRRRLAVLLWHDPYDAIDVKTCWSEAVRRDLRAMPDEQRQRWSAALKDIPVSDSTEPPNAFKKASSSRVSVIGPQQLREQLLVWLKPFSEDQPVRLTMAGSHILKGLLWYCRLVRDERLDAAVLSLLDTKWRNKEFVFRPLTVLAGNLVEFPPETSRPAIERIREQLGSKASARFDRVLKEVGATPNERPAPKNVQDPLSGVLQRMFDPVSGRLNLMGPNAVQSGYRYDGEYIEIEGQGDRYRAHPPTCTIRRMRDNAIVEVDYDRVPDSLRTLIGVDDNEFQRFTKLLFVLSMDAEHDFIVFRKQL